MLIKFPWAVTEPRHEGEYVGALGKHFHVSKEEKQENTVPFVPWICYELCI